MSIKLSNNTKDTIRFVPYRIDGLRASKNDAPKIDGGECFRIDGKDLRKEDLLDTLIVLVFLEDSKIPPSVTITQATVGGGGGITIFGFGGSASVTTTVVFSQPVAAARVTESSKLTFQLTDPTMREFGFAAPPAGEDVDCKKVHDFSL